MSQIKIPKKIQPSIDAMADVAQLLFLRGWAESNAGNLSMDITLLFPSSYPRKNNLHQHFLHHPLPKLANARFLVTAAGTRMRDIARQPHLHLLLIKINKNGSAYIVQSLDSASKNVRPTSELLTHLAIYNDRMTQKEPIRAILHTHPSELIALTHIPELLNEEVLNRTLWGIHPEALLANPAGIGFVPYLLTGSEALSHATRVSFRNHAIALWEKHGCIAAAASIDKAFDLVDVANKTAGIYLLCRNAGIKPTGLTDLQLLELRQLCNQ